MVEVVNDASVLFIFSDTNFAFLLLLPSLVLFLIPLQHRENRGSAEQFLPEILGGLTCSV